MEFIVRLWIRLFRLPSSAKSAIGKSYIFAIGALALAGCGNEELTRDKAAELLKSTSLFSRQHNDLRIRQNAFNDGVQLGLWNRKGQIETEANIYFTSVRRLKLGLVDAFKLRFEVTGITDEPISDGVFKKIEFQWSYEGLTPAAAYFVRDNGSGNATARLYDDGWRIQAQPKFGYSQQPYQAGDAARAAILKLSKSIADRHIAERARIERIKKAKLARLQSSKSETRMVYKVKYVSRPTAGGVPIGRPRQYRIGISDSHIYFSNSYGNYRKIWFGYFNKIEPFAMNLVSVYFNCPNYTGSPSSLYSMPVKYRGEFQSQLSSALARWKKKHSEFYGSENCQSADPGISVR